MSFLSPLAALPPRFAPIIAGLCRAVASQGAACPAFAPLLMLVWHRLQRMAKRLTTAAQRAEAGTPPRRRAGPRPSGPCERLPGGFAWLVRLVPEAACYGGQLQHLLSDPEVAAALAATPGAGRVLRPLCRMLGVAPGPALAPSVARESATAGGDLPARGEPVKRGSRERTAEPSANRALRSRVPRSFGRPWLRWRPAGVTP